MSVVDPLTHARPRRRGPARGGRVGDALRHQRQHLRAGDDDRREGRRPDPRQGAPARPPRPSSTATATPRSRPGRRWTPQDSGAAGQRPLRGAAREGDRGQGPRPCPARRRGHRHGVAGQGPRTDPRPHRSGSRRTATASSRTCPRGCCGDDAHLKDVVDRLREAGVDDVFVPAGDADPPAGAYEGALPVLRRLASWAAPSPRRHHRLPREPSAHPRRHHHPGHVGQARPRHVHRQQPVLRPRVLGEWVGRIRRRESPCRCMWGSPGPSSGRSCSPWRRRSASASRRAS